MRDSLPKVLRITHFVLGCLLIAFCAAALFYQEEVTPFGPVRGIGNRASTVQALPEVSEGSTYRFLVMANTAGSQEVSERLLERGLKENVEFGIHLGDLVPRMDRESFHFILAEMTEHSRSLPRFLIPGEKDVPGAPSSQPALFEELFGGRRFVFQVAGDLLIGIDLPSGESLSWLRGVLESHPLRRSTFLFCHSLPPGGEGGFRELVQSHGISYVLHADGDTFSRQVEDGCVFLGLGNHQAPGVSGPEGDPHRCAVLEVSPQGVTEQILHSPFRIDPRDDLEEFLIRWVGPVCDRLAAAGPVVEGIGLWLGLVCLMWSLWPRNAQIRDVFAHPRWVRCPPQLPGLVLLGLLGLILVVRTGIVAVSPLGDPSESRYAEIGREMVSSGDWVTPRLDPDQPFLGKPPLHFWLTGFSLMLFGCNDWAARIPSLVLSLLMLGTVVLITAARTTRKTGLLAALILASSGLFFPMSGLVLTDLSLAATVTLSMGFFYGGLRSVHRGDVRGSRLWFLLFFLSTGLSVLAKGLSGPALIGVALSFWYWRNRRSFPLSAVPWRSGLVTFLAVVVPWFCLAERSNPGFLRYLFLNEHLYRFLYREYGDQYGHGHAYPYGTIWLLGLVAFLPWSPLYLREQWRRIGRGSCPFDSFLFWWAVSPMILFCFSRNIVITYVLPGLPPMAVLLAGYLRSVRTYRQSPAAPFRFLRWTTTGMAGFLLLAIGFALYFVPVSTPVRMEGAVALVFLGGAMVVVTRWKNPNASIVLASLAVPFCTVLFMQVLQPVIRFEGSSRSMVAASTGFPRGKVVFFQSVPYSAQFYSQGNAVSAGGSSDAVRHLLESEEDISFLIRHKRTNGLPPDLLGSLRFVRENDDYILLEKEKSAPGHPMEIGYPPSSSTVRSKAM